MASYELSQKADQDLANIYRYSYKTFGENQADKYFQDLERCLESLANHSLQGRMANEIEEGMFRYEYASHTIFYVIRTPGIFVAHILHKSMDHKQHF